MPVRLALLLALIAAGPFPAALAADWTPLDRGEALEQTRSPQMEQRRLAYARLAEVGTQEDVPLVMAALRDEEPLIRGMAEQVVWGIWMRTDDPVADPMFQTSLLLLVEDEPAQAMEKLNEVMALKPQFAEAWNRRGDAWAAMGDTDRALDDYSHAIELNPYHFGALESCGYIWLERGDHARAADYLRRALDLNPNLREAAVTLAQVEERMGRGEI